MLDYKQTLDLAYQDLQKRVPPVLLNARVAIICGSGLGTLAQSLQRNVTVAYDDISGFARSTGSYLVPHACSHSPSIKFLVTEIL